MARVSRIKSHLDGQAYHVMNRTVRQAFLFDDDLTKEWIYQEILNLSSIYTADLHAIAVMSNHYHIVLTMRKTPMDESQVKTRYEAFQKRIRHPRQWQSWMLDEWTARLTDLSHFMQDVNASIARYVNRRDKVKGRLWGDRFKSTLLDDGEGFLRCMAYVEMNPVEAGICARPSDYRFCSIGRFHQGGRKAAGVTFPKLRGFEFAKTAAQRQKAFRMFLDYLADRERGEAATLPLESQAFLESMNLDEFMDLVLRRSEWALNSLVLGSETFCRDMIARFHLQTALVNRPFRLAEDLFNTHMRAGPHAYG